MNRNMGENSIMEEIIRSIYSHWNDGNLDDVLGAFTALGPKGFTIEYAGEQPLDGKAAVQDMWDNYGSICKTEVIELIVNGDEAAALIHNNVQGENSIDSLPSFEIYKVENGQLNVRYFHKTPEGTYLQE